MQQIDDLLQGVYDLLMKAYPENSKFHYLIIVKKRFQS